MKPKIFLLKFIFAFILLTSSMLQSYAQIGEGGTPPSFAYQSMQKQVQVPYVAPVNFDVKQLIAQDAQNESYGHPPIVGRVITADLSMENAGEWSTLPSGERLWKLTIQAPEAIALMLYYDEFYIPKGGKLYIYNKEKTQVLGAYTENTNLWGQAFATEFVAGDEITLEYVMPKSNTKAEIQQFNVGSQTAATEPANKARIKISGISYGYNHLEVFTRGKQKAGLNESGSCQVNINCSEGDAWQSQKKGVVRMLIRVGEKVGACSGTIVNNAKDDLTPYMLSANHCFTSATEESYRTITFYFHFEYPGCSNGTTTPATTKTLVGADPMVLIPMQEKSDGALLKLRQTILPEWDVYWNGWDVSSAMPKKGAGIHHPQGDVKKIATYITPGIIGQFKGSENAADIGNTNGHINVVYQATANGHSVTEGGSSGSPLFNENGLVVGTLSGGNTNGCINLSNSTTLYGRLWYHWDQAGTTDNMKMKTYLDPENTGVKYLQGRYSTGIIKAGFTSDKQKVFASDSVQFIDQSYGAKKYNWTFAGGTPSTSTDRNPVVTYSTLGDFVATLVINQGDTSERTAVKTITVVQKKSACPTLVVVGTDTSTSQFPLGLLKDHVLSSSIYKIAELGNTARTITQLAWFAHEAPLTATHSLKVYLKEVDDATQTAATWNDEIAGATLVYNSPLAEYNVIQWNTITLNESFKYSGTKNLKVMVYSKKGEGTNTSSKCFYSAATSAQMEWTPSITRLYDTLGRVTSKRPNIIVTFDDGCTAVVPVSNFSIQQYEGFDLGVFPPKNWKMESKGENQRLWQRGSYEAAPFKNIDPANANSAFITQDKSGKEIDTWLISKAYIIPNNATLEFYLGYHDGYLSKGAFNFYVSTDNGQTWGNAKWTTGTTDIPNAYWQWHKQAIDLSAYAGENLLFAWQFKGLAAHLNAVDGIKLYSADGKMSIYENETVQLVDLTTGPPMQWNWEIASKVGTKDTTLISIVQNISSLKYTLKGSYNISLNTSNNLGNNVVGKTIPVTVVGRAPAVAYRNIGLNRHPEYGAFIPPANPTMIFYDESIFSPTAWTWTFNGGTPAVSSAKNVQVRYPVTNATYPLSFKASNSTGNNTMTVNEAVTVGSKAWVWNMRPGETTDNAYTFSNGYISGSNTLMGYGSESFTEVFDLLAPVEVNKLKIAFKVGAVDTGYVLVFLRRDNGDGQPLTPNGLTSVKVNVKDMSRTGYTEVTFPKPFGAFGKLHVTIKGFDEAKGATAWDLAIKSSPPRPMGQGTMMVMNGAMDPYNAHYWGELLLYDFSLNVVTEILYSTLSPSASEILYPSTEEAKTLGISSNCSWEVSCTAPWITLTNNTGTGDGMVNIKCSKNTGTARTASVVLTGGGHQHLVSIRQAGINAVAKLTAQIDPDNKSHANLQWALDTSFYRQKDLFDNFESHEAFTNASPGTAGWQYIDVDKCQSMGTVGGLYMFSTTYNNGDVRLLPHSFLIYNRDKLVNVNNGAVGFPGGGWMDNSLSAHSGDQAIASIAPWALNLYADDWFISPPLNFEKDFKFSFWAKGSITSANMRVLYSTSGCDPSDFTVATTSTEYTKLAADIWVFHEFTIPKSVRYVAINHQIARRASCYGLFVDDVFIGTGNRPDGSPAPTIQSEMTSNNPAVITKKKSATFQPAFNVVKPEPAANTLSQKAGLYEIGKKLQWCSNEEFSFIGFENGDPITVGAKWTAAELAPYKGLRIAKVNIAVGFGTSYNVKIYQGGQLVSTQVLSNLISGIYNSIPASVIIDPSKDLMITYTGSGSSPVGLDESPTKDGKGNLIYDAEENEWLTMKSLGYEGNWTISATLGSANGLGYKVLRQDMEIGRSETLDFTDPNLPTKGSVCYTVHTLYDDGTESLPSNKACIEIVEQEESIDPSQLKAPEGFSPNGDGTNDTFVIEGIEQFADNTLSVFDVNGKIHFSAKGYNNTWDGVASQGEFKGKKLPVGIYYYILTVNGSSEKRSAVVIKY